MNILHATALMAALVGGAWLITHSFNGTIGIMVIFGVWMSVKDIK